MTESEWLTCADPTPMLEFLRGKASDRKLRLFACACLRRVWYLVPENLSRQAVETSERCADGLASQDELVAISKAAYEVFNNYLSPAPFHLEQITMGCFWAASLPGPPVLGPWERIHGLVCQVLVAYTFGDEREADYGTAGVKAVVAAEKTDQANFVRCIFGNPLRASPPLPHAVLAWNHRTIPRLAEAIYEERKLPEGTFNKARLTALANALIDAGCEDEALIQHLREPPHVRGCWAVDLISGKE